MIPVHVIDEKVRIIALELPSTSIVLLQGLFETYEGIATIRSLDSQKGIISVITTADCLEDCLSILKSTQKDLNWRPCLELPKIDFLG